LSALLVAPVAKQEKRRERDHDRRDRKYGRPFHFKNVRFASISGLRTQFVLRMFSLDRFTLERTRHAEQAKSSMGKCQNNRRFGRARR
jgi:hypothetical protein